MKRLLIFVHVVLILISSAYAEVRLPAILADHMVLQRNRPVHIWGWASAGEVV